MAGSTKITASGVLGTADKPLKVYSVVIASTSLGASSAQLRNGSAATDSLVDVIGAEADGVATKSYGNHGKYFPAGLYVNLGLNVLHVDIDWEQITIS